MANDLKRFILIIFITIAIIIILNIVFRSALIYILFNTLKNNGISTTNIVFIAVIAIIYVLFLKSNRDSRVKA